MEFNPWMAVFSRRHFILKRTELSDFDQMFVAHTNVCPVVGLHVASNGNWHVAVNCLVAVRNFIASLSSISTNWVGYCF